MKVNHKTLSMDDLYGLNSESEPVEAFREDVYGVAAIINASRDILKGAIVRFGKGARDPESGDFQVVEAFTFALGKGGDPKKGYAPITVRYCGEENDPNGAGSHALTPPDVPNYCMSETAIAVHIALVLKGSEFFRLKNAGVIKWVR